MKILIIGGTRFMGPHVVRSLASAGHEVAVFHRGETPAELPGNVTEILGDRNNLRDFAGPIRAFAPEIVLDMMLLNELQAKELVKVTAGVARRLVVAGSCDVYLRYDLLRGVESGAPDSARVTEESELRRRLYPYRSEVADEKDLLYNYDKIPVERAVMSQERIEGTVLRLPVVYGPGDYRHRFYSYLRRMSDNRPAILIGASQAALKITRGYSENCAAAIALAVMNEKSAGRIYNVGELQPLPEREWIGRLAGITGWTGNIIELPEEDLPKHLHTDMQCRHHLDIDTSRLREELGFAEPVDSDEALRRTTGWELANPPEKDDFETEYAAEDVIIAAAGADRE